MPHGISRRARHRLALEWRAPGFCVRDAVDGIEFAGEVTGDCLGEAVWILCLLENEFARAALKPQVAPDDLLIFRKKRNAQLPFQDRRRSSNC